MMSLVIVSRLSKLAIGRRHRRILQRGLDPLLALGAVGSEIGWLRRVLLAQERQMRLQVVVAGSLPFTLVGESSDGLLAGVEEIRDEAFILHPLIAARCLDGLVVRLREFRVLER